MSANLAKLFTHAILLWSSIIWY